MHYPIVRLWSPISNLNLAATLRLTMQAVRASGRAQSAWSRASLRSGQTWRLWRDEFGPSPPFPIGADTLFVAYYASAELGCLRALGWPMPDHILDLFTEFRDRTNGLTTPAGAGLLGALTYFGLDSIGSHEKDELRALVLRGGPWSDRERAASSTTARATSWRSSACCRRCCRASTCRGHCCAAATWPRRPPWSGTACRSTCRR